MMSEDDAKGGEGVGWEVPDFQPFDATLRGADLGRGCVITRRLIDELAGIGESGARGSQAVAVAIPALVNAIYMLELRLVADGR